MEKCILFIFLSISLSRSDLGFFSFTDCAAEGAVYVVSRPKKGLRKPCAE